MTADAALAELARAKINLFLHVRGRRADGYHLLESLVVFPRLGDRLEASPAGVLSLRTEGPFAEGLPADAGNLVIAAARALSVETPGRPGAMLRLEKRLPVASGVGGGSADAGAALRLLLRLWPDAPSDATERIAATLGADVPVCLAQRPAMMSGAGERLAPAPSAPGFWILLANPREPLSTAEVFGALERRDGPPGPPPPSRFQSFDDLVGWLEAQRNDLEPPARRFRPVIDQTLAALAADGACALARMSGSGATCFGLYKGEAEARAAEARLSAARAGWWVAAAEVEPST